MKQTPVRPPPIGRETKTTQSTSNATSMSSRSM